MMDHTVLPAITPVIQSVSETSANVARFNSYFRPIQHTYTNSSIHNERIAGPYLTFVSIYELVRTCRRLTCCQGDGCRCRTECLAMNYAADDTYCRDSAPTSCLRSHTRARAEQPDLTCRIPSTCHQLTAQLITFSIVSGQLLNPLTVLNVELSTNIYYFLYCFIGLMVPDCSDAPEHVNTAGKNASTAVTVVWCIRISQLILIRY